MSKAFTKESDEGPGPGNEVHLEPKDPLPGGYEELRDAGGSRRAP